MISRHGFVVIAPDGHIQTDGFEHPDDDLPGSCREAGIEHMRWAISVLESPEARRLVALSDPARLALADEFRRSWEVDIPDMGFLVVGPDGTFANDPRRWQEETITDLQRAIAIAETPPYHDQICGADLSQRTWEALAAEFDVRIPADVREWWRD